ncbi:MAG: hypothetical protein ACR2FU_15985 [Streptosporangiaceae bacterium]
MADDIGARTTLAAAMPALASCAARSPLHRMAIRDATAHWAEQGWITSRDAASLSQTADHGYREPPLDAAEVRTLLDGVGVPLRDRVLWAAIWESAAPVSDVLRLQVNNIVPATMRGYLHYPWRPSEVITWGPVTAQLLPDLIGTRSDGPLFLAGQQRLTYREAAAAFARVTGGHTLHSLRPDGNRGQRMRTGGS